MTEYVPARKVRRLVKRAESDGDVFPDDTPAQRLGYKFADDLRECLDEHAVTEAEVCDGE
ncbi:hypothetical protein HRTV-28_gp26 [Halorubrum tailed virus 28]|uniref:Uncharacterized protein n=1 Tax=Halorubrum tailed virus 28 TaxID=2878009 RepID=A0AAE8Y0V7_9CAUD|nr:hypothetical protein M1M39_gp27 [Halorubrum tailed virus 28]UBF23464.1 hypothetical protein HRTV-28_gp26 [Halorubrum tailed virus 28]